MTTDAIDHSLEEIVRAREGAEIDQLYRRWVEASAAEDRILQLYDEGRATPSDVQQARETANAAWQPYRIARATLTANKERTEGGQGRA
jgi:hypothetical protein